MEILGKCKIIKKEYNERIKYSTRISQKNKEGNYESMFIDMSFVGNASNPDINDKDIIIVTKAFLGFYTEKNGLAKPKIVVQDFEKDEETTYEDEERRGIMEADNINPDEQLPF